MGRKTTSEWVHILKEAELCYRKSAINTFVQMWNEGQPISAIARKLDVRVYEIALLIIHCELENQIKPRKGGIHGTLPNEYRGKKEAGKE